MKAINDKDDFLNDNMCQKKLDGGNIRKPIRFPPN